MNWLSIIEPILPPLITTIKDIIESQSKNDKEAVEALLKIIGNSEENKTRAALVVVNAKILKQLSDNSEKID